MKWGRPAAAFAVAAIAVASAAPSTVFAGRPASSPVTIQNPQLLVQQLPVTPRASFGRAISPALEGWWRNADGTSTMLIGYFNRNEAPIEVPVGADNRIEPGGPDLGQPTTFLAERQYGVFTVTVPRDFGSRRLTWTLTVNHQPQTIALWLNPPYVIDSYRNASNGNTPPVVRFAEAGPAVTGPPIGLAQRLEAVAGTPLPLVFWAADAGNTIALNRTQDLSGAGRPRSNGPIRVAWSKYRGPGEVTFEPIRPLVGDDGRTSSTAMFTVPGEYTLRAQVNDQSGDGGLGDACCWTNVHVQVIVK